MERRKQAILLALPASLALLFFFILPMVYILIRTLTENGTADFTEFFTDPFYLDILWTTIRVSLVSTAVSLLLGLGLISEPLKLLNTEAAVIIGMIHLLIPYMILSLVGVLQSIDPNVEYAAYSLGASPMTTFRKVVFPLSTPGIISGCVLVFTMSMTSYVTPKLLGGSKFRMMATMVVQEINVNFDWGAASAISYILLAVILAVQVVVVLVTGRYMKRMGGGKNA